MTMETDLNDDAETAGKLSLAQITAIALLLVIPVLVMVGKTPGTPTAEFLKWLSFADVPRQAVVGHVLFVPLGALLVTFFRLTIGIRVLGPFRPILIAFAFQLTGILPGITFLAITVAVIISVRPLIRNLHMPYFGRITVMLSTVALLISMAILLAASLHLDNWSGMAHFPVVVLCLVSEAFSRSLKIEGLRCGLWRGAMTVFVAVVLTLLAENSHVMQLLLYYPEVLFILIGMTTVISKYCAWRLLASLNPLAVIQRKVKASASTNPADSKTEVAVQRPPLVLAATDHEGASSSRTASNPKAS
jgi:hypothetical protein